MLFVCALFVLAGGFGGVAGKAKEKKTFTVGFDAAFPPYGYQDDSGEYVGLEGFERRKQNDKIKREYCENHGIFLLEIIYKLRSKQKIEKEIMNILDSATITV